MPVFLQKIIAKLLLILPEYIYFTVTPLESTANSTPLFY